MCGDLEEENTEAERLYAAFLHAAHAAIHEAVDHRGGSRNHLDGQSDDQTDAVSDAALHGYMDGLFGDILNACIKDSRRVGDRGGYRVLASQSIVLARLAGFLAGQLDLREDPLRNSIEALMAGYGAQNSDHTHD
ncbi:MAG: hypothetical protein QOI88_775 [Gammaproteobacteria bacterium]|jgi:hypothetical protein|nr:hypothetical protein [Gammaproteobacteria bacterium]